MQHFILDFISSLSNTFFFILPPTPTIVKSWAELILEKQWLCIHFYNSCPQQAFGPSSSPNVHAFSFSFLHAMLHPHVHLCASIIHTLQAVICRRESASRFYVTSANLPPTPSIFLKNSVMPFFFRAEWYSVLYTCQVFTVHSPGRILTNPPSGIS